MRAIQDEKDGRRTADAIERNRKHYSFWEDERKMIEQTEFFFVATAWRDYVDCSIKSGEPGFVKIVSDNELEYPEYDGNSMYRTLGNMESNPSVGLLFVRFDGVSLRMRINGKASVLRDSESLARHYGAKFVVRVVCEIYPNCPRYVPNLVDQTASPYIPREGGGVPPAPEWKTRDYIAAELPHDDPHRKRKD